MSRDLPDYEREAQEVEARGRAKAEAIRQAGRAMKPRAELVGELYDLLGVEPIEKDRAEAKRRRALRERIEGLLALEAGQAGRAEQPRRSAQPVAERAPEPQQAPPGAQGWGGQQQAYGAEGEERP